MPSNVPPVRELDLDGLTVFLVDTPPPLAVSLSFRCGVWDESLFTRGITHLVEHLALHPLRNREHQFNGSVGGDSMSFWASGSEAHVVEFFAALTEQLRSLPVGRLERETSVLKAEAALRTVGAFDFFPSMFFGPNGPGLSIHEELGFDLVGPQELQAWADRHCTKSNAVLMVGGGGALPEELVIDLPVGEYQPFAAPGTDVGYRPTQPELVQTQGEGISLGSLADRSAATVLGWDISTRRLKTRLRHDLGLVYEIVSAYTPVDGDMAYVFVGVDAIPERASEVATQFMNVVHELRTKGPTPEEVSRAKKIDFESAAKVDVAVGELSRVAMNRLLRYPEDPWPQLEAEREAATPETVGAAFRAATDHAAVIAPHAPGLGLPSKRWSSDHRSLGGKMFRPKRYLAGGLEALTVGAEGLSAACEGTWLNMPWPDIVMAARPEPTMWRFLNHHGAWLVLDTNDWRWRGRLARRLEGLVPAHVRVPKERGP